MRHSGAAIGTLFGLMFVPMIVAGMFGESGIAVGRFVPLLMLLNSIAVTSPVPGLFAVGSDRADVRVRGGGDRRRRCAAPPGCLKPRAERRYERRRTMCS